MAKPRLKTLDDVMQRCYVDPDSGCWLWRGAKYHGAGYPLARLSRNDAPGAARNAPVAQLIYALTHGGQWAPAGTYYWTRCGHTACLAPKHQMHGSCKQRWAWLIEQGWRRSPAHEAALLRGVKQSQARRQATAPTHPPARPRRTAVRGASVFHLA